MVGHRRVGMEKGQASEICRDQRGIRPDRRPMEKVTFSMMASFRKKVLAT